MPLLHRDAPPEHGGKHHEQMVRARIKTLRERFPKIKSLAYMAVHAPGSCVKCDALRKMGE